MVVRNVTIVVVLLAVVATTDAAAQSPDVFRNAPAQYFASQKSSVWVGSGTYFSNNYTDTLQILADSSGRGLVLRRSLVQADRARVISRGTGYVTPDPGDSTYSVRWDERGYQSVTGRMRWLDGQWVISFVGEWKEWSIRVRQDSIRSLVASAARMIPGFRPVEIAAMTYKPTP